MSQSTTTTDPHKPLCRHTAFKFDHGVVSDPGDVKLFIKNVICTDCNELFVFPQNGMLESIFLQLVPRRDYP